MQNWKQEGEGGGEKAVSGNIGKRVNEMETFLPRHVCRKSRTEVRTAVQRWEQSLERASVSVAVKPPAEKNPPTHPQKYRALLAFAFLRKRY